MRSVRIAALAEDDLQSIWEYIAQYNSESASKLIRELVSTFGMLRDSPHAGRAQPTLAKDLRSFVVRGYFIFYRPFDDRIEILRVLHGSRDIETIFERFLESF